MITIFAIHSPFFLPHFFRLEEKRWKRSCLSARSIFGIRFSFFFKVILLKNNRNRFPLLLAIALMTPITVTIVGRAITKSQIDQYVYLNIGQKCTIGAPKIFSSTDDLVVWDVDRLTIHYIVIHNVLMVEDVQVSWILLARQSGSILKYQVMMLYDKVYRTVLLHFFSLTL